MDSLCHPCITTTHLSYSFLSLKLPPPPCAVLLVTTETSWKVLWLLRQSWELWHLSQQSDNVRNTMKQENAREASTESAMEWQWKWQWQWRWSFPSPSHEGPRVSKTNWREFLLGTHGSHLVPGEVQRLPRASQQILGTWQAHGRHMAGTWQAHLHIFWHTGSVA